MRIVLKCGTVLYFHGLPQTWAAVIAKWVECPVCGFCEAVQVKGGA